MTQDPPAALQRAGIRRLIHNKPAGASVTLPNGLLVLLYGERLLERLNRIQKERCATSPSPNCKPS